MKRAAVVAVLIAIPILVGAQSGMKGMDMKGMDMGKSEKMAAVHRGTGVVTNVDRKGGKVTLKHDPIKSLNWPTMTMAFTVKDKAMLDKLAKDKKVEFEFVQQGQQFVITSIK